MLWHELGSEIDAALGSGPLPAGSVVGICSVHLAEGDRQLLMDRLAFVEGDDDLHLDALASQVGMARQQEGVERKLAFLLE